MNSTEFWQEYQSNRKSIVDLEERNYDIMVDHFRPRIDRICALYGVKPDRYDYLEHQVALQPKAILYYIVYGTCGDSDYTDYISFPLDYLLCSDEEFAKHAKQFYDLQAMKKKQEEQKSLTKKIESLESQISQLRDELNRV